MLECALISEDDNHACLTFVHSRISFLITLYMQQPWMTLAYIILKSDLHGDHLALWLSEPPAAINSLLQERSHTPFPKPQLLLQ